MERVNKILAPTDLSELSSVGVRHALEMGRSRNAEVIVYHVIDIADGWITRRENFSPVREMLARQMKLVDIFLREKFADHMNLVEVGQLVEFGSPFTKIVETAKRERVDMIVMATHGRSGLHHLLVAGSVSARVVGRAPCPVLVIPAGGRAACVTKAA